MPLKQTFETRQKAAVNWVKNRKFFGQAVDYLFVGFETDKGPHLQVYVEFTTTQKVRHWQRFLRRVGIPYCMPALESRERCASYCAKNDCCIWYNGKDTLYSNQATKNTVEKNHVLHLGILPGGASTSSTQIGS